MVLTVAMLLQAAASPVHLPRSVQTPQIFSVPVITGQGRILFSDLIWKDARMLALCSSKEAMTGEVITSPGCMERHLNTPT